MPTTTSTTEHDRRRRRRIAGWGLLAFGAVAVGGAVEGTTRAERDLERRVGERLADAGITGVEVEFSGQDGTLRCSAPLGDPRRAEQIAEDLWGVRVAELDRSCTTGSGTAAGSGTTEGAGDDAGDSAGAGDSDDAAGSDDETPTTDASAGATDATDTTDTTEATPSSADDDADDAATDTTDATDATETTVEGDTTDAADGVVTVGDVTVELVDGRLVLTGPVADEAARAALLDAAASVVDPANIDDRLEIVGDGTGAADGGTGTSTDSSNGDSGGNGEGITIGVAAGDLDGLVSLVRAMPPNLVAGTVTRLGDGTLSIEGTYVDDAGRDAIVDAAEAAGVATADVALDERAEATVSDAARLTDELNDFVAANPILFQPNSATLTPEANAVVDQVAAIANRYAGVTITVEGHTDTDGDANRNLQLSTNRAQTVQNALLERGVTAPMEIVGFGETQPILAGGVEDKAASRRVVFQVSAA